MSFYIKVIDASVNNLEQDKKQTLLIRGKDSELKAQSLPQYSKPTWNIRFVCSNKEQMLNFILIDRETSKITSEGELSFSPFRCYAEKQLKETFIMSNHVKLALQIYYTKRKNYIGSLQFYQFSSFTTHQSSVLRFSAMSEKVISPRSKNTEVPIVFRGSTLKTEQQKPIFLSQASPKPEYKVEKQSPKKKGGFFNFFCCGEENIDDKLYQVEQDDRFPQDVQTHFGKALSHSEASPKIQFYKGACTSKNLFSCCDTGLNDGKFTVIENYYRDNR